MDTVLKRWPRNLASAAALALAVVTHGGGARAEPAGTMIADPGAPMVRYVVQPGDTLFRLASAWLIRPETYRQVQRLNQIADPLRLPIGKTLLIPRELLRNEPVRGKVEDARGDVRIDGRPASIGMAVGEGMLLETGPRSFVTLVLPDATSVALPSQSAVRVRRLRRVVLDSHVERLFAIERGRASAQVTPMRDPLSTFQFATPRAVTSVRGTRFRMGYDADSRRATSEVLEGKVGFDSEGKAAETLAAGYGSASDLAGPVALLPVPEWIDVGAAQAAERLHFALRPLPGARAYRVQLAADEGFVHLLDEVVSPHPEAELGPQPDGHYFVRATAIDANGLEGQPAVAAFDRRLVHDLALWVDSGWNGPVRQYVFHWDAPGLDGAQFRFQLVRASKERRPVVDREGLATRLLVGLALDPGRYRWRVESSRMAGTTLERRWSAWQDLRIEAGW